MEIDKKFSLILNSRNRVELLRNFFYSVLDKTSNIEDIEILVSFDNDDYNSLNFINHIFTNPHHQSWCDDIAYVLKYEFIFRNRNLHERINNLAKKAIGKYIVLLNDDVEFLTPNWDLIYTKLEDSSFPYKYISTKCNSADHGPEPYSSFPIISRNTVDKLGCLIPEEAVGLGGDVLIYRIFAKYGYIIDSDITFRHTNHETIEKVFNPDQTASEMRQLSFSNNFDFWNMDLNKYKLE